MTNVVFTSSSHAPDIRALAPDIRALAPDVRALARMSDQCPMTNVVFPSSLERSGAAGALRSAPERSKSLR
jgi:hypothetical protein